MNEEQQDDEDLLKEMVLPDLVVPDFKADIPGYVADGLTPKENHILGALSIMSKQLDFVVLNLKLMREQHNRVATITKIAYRRTQKYEKLVLMLTSKWSVVIYLIAALYPILSNKLIQKFWP